jgi:SSS family solute:Na+ symporter
MQLSFLDLLIIFCSIAICFIPALKFAKRAGSSSKEFFASGQSAPWWLIGISMVATTFSADTPNLVTDIVRQNGIAGNWVWWAFLLTGMATVFFYARLWRRSGVMTDLEFYELRYSGKPARFLRGFRSVYLGLMFNCIIMASVHLAAIKIAAVLVGWSPMQTLMICGAINLVFAATAGLWGVLVIDMVQFGIAMAGAIALAYFALQHEAVGGLDGLVVQLEVMHPNALNFFPSLDQGDLFWTLLILPLAVQWWSTWYPGSEPGGGSYMAQRMLASKSERDALAGTLFFNVAHYALRPWPWILVALASLLVFPGLDDLRKALPHVDPKLIGHDMAYPAMMLTLPDGFRGLMVAGLLAAYVSTIITHLNWGTSYLVHDLYHRFANPNASEKKLVLMGRLCTFLLLVISGVVVFALESAKSTFDLMLSIGAGTGALYLLRWFWWRINAWSEIAAMILSFAVAMALHFGIAGEDLSTGTRLLLTVGITSAGWILVTLLTPATDRATLLSFYRRIRPAGPGWAKQRAETRLNSQDKIGLPLMGWTLAVAFVWSALFWSGSLLLGKADMAWASGVVLLLSIAGLYKVLPIVWRGTKSN